MFPGLFVHFTVYVVETKIQIEELRKYGAA
jgi:hypothetical protein